MSVTVANDSAGALQDVGLKYRRRGNEVSEAVGAIKAHETRQVRIRFEGETFLYLLFRDADGKEHKEDIQIYLDGDVHSPITLHVSAAYVVRCDGCSP